MFLNAISFPVAARAHRLQRWAVWSVAVVLLITIQAAAFGQSSRVNIDSPAWLAEISAIRTNLNAESLPDLESAEASMSAAIEATRQYFRRATSASNFDDWMDYLEMQPLAEAIESNETIATKGRAALGLLPQLRGVERGLELPAIVHLREAVDRYIAALRYADPERGLSLVAKQLDGLADLLSDENALRDLDAQQRDQMELFLGGLADAGQASRLREMIRSRFMHPNLWVWINGEPVTDAVSRPVDNPNVVNECILGTRLRGQARVTGCVTAELLPQDGYVRMILRLRGTFATSTRGFRKPISLDSTGTGTVYTARQLAITPTRMILGEPVTTADISTRIQRIHHPLKIVRKIAMRQANESKPIAERISERKLRERVEKDFVEQTNEAARRKIPDVDVELNPWLSRLDFPPLQREIGSTSSEVYAHAKMQHPLGFAAAAPPPSAAMIRDSISRRNDGVHHDYLATFQIHESILGNTFGRLLAGQTFAPERIERIIEVLGIELPEREEQQEAIEIDFANFRPVYFEAGDQTLRLGLRATRLSRDGRELKVPVEVSAIYRPVIGEEGQMWLIRDEDVQFSFSSSRRLSLSQTAIKANLEEGFEKLFPLELLHRHLPVPPTIKAPMLAGRLLEIISIDLSEGWISITVE
ncbi:hypothetical protein [Neorhodopirellula pilleata]|uniref:Uncharacterized protein n=1 Tax=Neorhodopirellula pilleata TaxID=2714738 RepID=A0A5C6AVS5_9BACT|nr:hypothetical protein [Neorhodopirellula pilleata]TWU03551.1 hypothetical protein Pla100_04780 [Neorhodopirellula pilleata]